jgi:6-phospho-beta-glucosidase
MRNRIANALGVDGDCIWLDYFGLNHLAWIQRVFLGGRDITADLLAQIAKTPGQTGLLDFDFDKTLIAALGLIPSGYLRYFYHTDRVLEQMQRADRTRAEVVMEIDRELMALYKTPDLREKPKVLEQRGGAWYSAAAVALISAIANDKHEVHIVNVPNRGALKGLPDEAVVEVPALVKAVKAYEELAVEAAVTGSREAALLALVAHPLVPTADVAERLLARILEANRVYLPQFERG